MMEEDRKYPDYVKDIVFIGNKCKNIRYGLELFLTNDTNKEALVILENPSKANEEKGDRTICDFVLRVLNNLGYSKIIIVNIIPFYATYDEDISKDSYVLNNLDAYEYNRMYIERCMSTSIDIFVGWGTGGTFKKDFYNEKVKIIENLIKQTCYCSKINNDGTPKHPLYEWTTKKHKSIKDFIVYK